MITREQRDELRRGIAALDGTNYGINCFGEAHVEAVYVPAVKNLKSLLDALDEMERERDAAVLAHSEALDRVRGAMARADAAGKAVALAGASITSIITTASDNHPDRFSMEIKIEWSGKHPDDSEVAAELRRILMMNRPGLLVGAP